MKTSEWNAIQAEIAALRSGKTAPSRAWNLEKQADGSVRRTAMKPEAVRKANAAKEKMTSGCNWLTKSLPPSHRAQAPPKSVTREGSHLGSDR